MLLLVVAAAVIIVVVAVAFAVALGDAVAFAVLFCCCENSVHCHCPTAALISFCFGQFLAAKTIHAVFYSFFLQFFAVWQRRLAMVQSSTASCFLLARSILVSGGVVGSL